MICDYCHTDLKPTIVHKLVGDALLSTRGFECPACLATYDSAGTQLEKPLVQRSDADEKEEENQEE